MPGLFLRHGYVPYAPLWSLAVEEQFYMLWPLLYRNARRRGILFISLGLLVICPVLRALAFNHILHTGDPLSKTWMIADNLAIGCILAILVRSPNVTLKGLAAAGWAQFATGSLGLLILFGTHRMGRYDPLRNSIGLSCFMLICGSAVVMMLIRYRSRVVPRAFRVIVFFGGISYGLYLVHMLVLQMYDRIAGKEFGHGPLVMRFVVANGIAIGIAVLSKRFFEDPVLRLKSRIAAS
jgi:peptidoglycan/LPS O-acetylase OafA/YrhL